MASETKAKKKQKRKKNDNKILQIAEKLSVMPLKKMIKKYEIFTNSEKKCNNSYSHGSFEISKEI